MAEDIRSLRELAPYVSVGATFKYSMDNGRTWAYVKITRDELETFDKVRSTVRGYAADAEVAPRGADRFHPLVDRDFQEGMIVRVATAKEVRNKKWSYD